MGTKRQHEEDEDTRLAGKEAEVEDTKQRGTSDSDDESNSDGEKDIVDVDFEFFDPKEIDYHAMKRMMITSFGDDAEDFNISQLVDMIIEQNTIGSTVKMDGDDDPYAFLTVLNMNAHKDKEVIKQIKDYLLKKSEGTEAGAKLAEILKNEKKDVGFLINERVINMPPQISPPMFKMLMEELEWAVEDKEPYSFEWYILLAPTYKDIANPDNSDDSDDEENSKSIKRRRHDTGSQIYVYLHQDEEFIEEFAQVKFDYKFSRSKRVAEIRNSFSDTGLVPGRRCLLIHKSKARAMIDRLESALAP